MAFNSSLYQYDQYYVQITYYTVHTKGRWLSISQFCSTVSSGKGTILTELLQSEVMSCGRDPIVMAAEAVAMVLASEGCCFTAEGRKHILYRVTHPENNPLPGKAT